MAEAKHTPGPWQVSEYARPGSMPWHIRSDLRHWSLACANTLTGCSEPGMDIDEAECLANAYLIAAAPEMLASLAAIVGFCDDPDGSEKGVSLAFGLAGLLPAARAALIKATPDHT